MKINHAVIMAAGRGQRMMPLTNAIAKPMAPYLDTTLIGHGIAQIKKHINNIHITVGYKASEVGKHVIELGISSVLNTDGHSNSWWIHNTLLKNLNEPIFVLTCDNVTNVDFNEISNEYERLNSPECMLVPAHPIDGLYGDYIFHDESGLVTSLSRVYKTDRYCSGIQVINPKRINDTITDSNDFYDVWNVLIAKKQLFVSSIFPSKWTAIDTMLDLQLANEGIK